MRWRGERESSNVEDRRNRGGGVPRKAGAMGGGALILVILAMLFGLDPSKLLSGLGGGQLGGGPASAAGGAPVEDSAATKEMKQFMSVVLASTEDVFRKLFQEKNMRYQDPVLVHFNEPVATACGTQSPQVGPFYCPGDHKVYIDMGFFEMLRGRLGADGDFAQAYVIAHEVGHHVQNLMGFSEKVHRMRGRVSEVEQNRLSVRLELQADFLAGVWAHHAQKMRNILERGDIEEAMNAAAAVGDDKLQREATGTVRPESFTHGTSEQRMNAFKLGFQTGDLARAADFFN